MNGIDLLKQLKQKRITMQRKITSKVCFTIIIQQV